MKPELAKKRYMSMMIGSSLGYIATVFVVSYTHGLLTEGSTPAIILSLVPAVPICLMLWSIWRFLDEMDEVARHVLTQSMLFGLFVLLALSGAWGLVELFNDSMPRLPIFFVFPAFFIIFGLVTGFKYKRWA